MPNFIVIFLFSTIISLGACSQNTDTQSREHHSQLLALGTLIDINLWNVDKDKASTVVHAIDNRLQEFHHHWHAWQPGRLTDINQALSSGQSIKLDAAESMLIQQASQLSERSQGLFNPAIGRLIELWGFHSDNPHGKPPTAVEINTLLKQQPKMSDLQFDDLNLSTTNTAVQLDMGGFAKGLAVDQAIEIIKQFGINDAIVNAGGDLRAIGTHGDRPWHIGIRHPQQSGVIAAIDTHGDESVFTSGNYERFFIHNEQRYHHIINPGTGYPATGTLSATVIHSNAATADAIATALMIAGPDRWRETARQMNADLVMVIDDQLKIHLTPAMRQRVKFEHPQSIIFSEEPS